ncbi:MAG: hypothetical protein GX575_25020 [Candidatus Anammoximicrobium sp.]|nr:hypothetical protein [Candidatus Anammoximicrobium sp.]
MSVLMESSKPLEELIDPKYAKRRGIGPAKRMLDSLLWASENLLLCVVREKDGDGGETVKVRPELAATAPPTMAALTFLQAWAGLPPGKLAETITRLTMKVSDKLGTGKGKTAGRGPKVDAESGMVVLSAEAQRRVEALERRIEAARGRRAVAGGR